MIRIIVFLILIAAAALGAAWVADQAGTVNLVWRGWRIETTLPVFAAILGVTFAVAAIAWAIIRGVWRTPDRMRRAQRERRVARGRQAVTDGLLAIGHGDSNAARRHAQTARRIAGHDPLSLLLDAQSAQLDGDRVGAERAFRAMAERSDTRLLGLRGLFIEAQRNDDPFTAVAIAEEALKLAPASPWASHAVLGFRCARSDWRGALDTLDKNAAAGLIDRATHRRQRGVLLTAQALDLETSERDAARDMAAEAVKLAPTLVPAAVLAAKFQSEQHQVRRAMKLIETAWLANPHPDLADAYAHVRLGDSARQRLVRVETLAQKMPGHIEGALAIARAALDANEFSRARDALAPLLAAPTQRVAMLMAEIERTEHGDSGKARGWMLRAVRALPDAVWTADGYVSDRWRPVSPVSGRLDAFQWLTPLAALPSGAPVEVEAQEPMIAASKPAAIDAKPVDDKPVDDAAVQDNTPKPATEEAAPESAAPTSPPPQPAAPPPIFRARQDAKPAAPIPAVIPIVRAPDDPGVAADEAPDDEFADQPHPPRQQTGGWRGFLARWSA
ncbi:MAG: hypothetical protein A4S14_11465 [Proteobacteria bacterium SG_bin9]|nr:MAG: hypothetical protein A4S14_11465 [Proteobacteria bacterium SG_bin9]